MDIGNPWLKLDIGNLVKIISRFLIVAGLVLASWLGFAIGQEPSKAELVIAVPLDARVFFDDAPTTQTGTERSYSTPPLTPGMDYGYTIRADVVRNGRTYSQKQKVTVRAGQTVRLDFSTLGVSPTTSSDADVPPPADVWPRKVEEDGLTITLYQPQLEHWDGNRLDARAAVSIETKASPQPNFGVARLTARTEVDKERRLVTLDNVAVVGAEFPAAGNRAADFAAALRKAMPAGSRTIALSRLEANLAVTQAETKTAKPDVKNDVPRIIYSQRPGVLVLVDGEPVLRQVDGIQLLRAINTRALLLLDQPNGRYYLHLFDRWLQAAALAGPWTALAKPLPDLQTALDRFGKDPQVDLLDDLAPDLKEVLANGGLPAVFVSTVPAELIDTEGEPALEPVPGTQLLWVKNTTDQLLLNPGDQNYYALLSGRWFRSKSLTEGPWEFVRADQMPADFAKVPETHPRGDVLSAVAGTPQAQEATLAHQVPQTATIDRSSAKIEPLYDGDPQFEPVDGTQLKYAVNSPTPVVQVNPNSYYACENGVWFTAAAPTGPWAAATEVPPAIYTIPPQSPLYYVTQVYVYGYTPQYVYTGYSPGYLGAYLCPQGVVVYGTGWAFRPWIGRYWFGRPWTYGWGARIGWTPAGWGFGFGAAVGRPWGGPVGWNAGWGGSAWRAGWERGWGGAYAGVHMNHVNFNNFNLYNRWGNNVHVNAVRNTTINRTTNVVNSQRSLNNVVAGHDNQVYRRSEAGWDAHAGGASWNRVDANRLNETQRTQFNNTANRLNQDWSARRAGEANYNNFHAVGERTATGGYAGFHGGTGFRGSVGGRRR